MRSSPEEPAGATEEMTNRTHVRPIYVVRLALTVAMALLILIGALTQ
jgi:hypothetical protein